MRAYGKPFLGHSLGISGINTKSAAHNVQTPQRFAGKLNLTTSCKIQHHWFVADGVLCVQRFNGQQTLVSVAGPAAACENRFTKCRVNPHTEPKFQLSALYGGPGWG